MNDDALFERVLDKLDTLTSSLARVEATMTAEFATVKAKQDHTNGNVSDLQASDKEQNKEIEEIRSRRIDKDSLLQITKYICVTAIIIFGAKQSEVFERLASLLK